MIGGNPTAMTVAFFDTLDQRDFDNGGILDDIRKAMEEREELLEEVKRLRALLAKPYPIQGGPTVPWWVMLPHEAQSQRNHGQSIKRIAERGGFSSAEAWCVIRGLGLRELSSKKNLAEADLLWRKFAARVNNPNETSDPATIINEVCLQAAESIAAARQNPDCQCFRKLNPSCPVHGAAQDSDKKDDPGSR